jgi:hypothetical protein
LIQQTTLEMEIKGKTTETIINDIETHILTCPGKLYSEFFIGTTHDPIGKLFSEHHVNEKTDCWSYHRAMDVKSALAAKKQMQDKGMKGDTEDCHDYCIYVYCYHITTKTVE